MGQQPSEDLPPWRETPLDHWSSEIDPAIMAGDEWVDEQADPGSEWFRNHPQVLASPDRFMHPTQDSNYGLEDDVFQTGQS